MPRADGSLKPGEPGYRGHKVSRGLRQWQQVRCLRNKKLFWPSREAWARFRATAKIHPSLSIKGALLKLQESGKDIDYRTLTNLINGMTDSKLSTVIDICDAWDCSVDGFARAMAEAWELAERRWEVESAMSDALKTQIDLDEKPSQS